MLPVGRNPTKLGVGKGHLDRSGVNIVAAWNFDWDSATRNSAFPSDMPHRPKSNISVSTPSQLQSAYQTGSANDGRVTICTSARNRVWLPKEALGDQQGMNVLLPRDGLFGLSLVFLWSFFPSRGPATMVRYVKT
jgi:hypothetical protein